MTVDLAGPFAYLFDHPAVVLGALGYVLTLGAVSIALGGYLWEQGLWLYNAWDWRGQEGRYGPEWYYVPPRRVYGTAALITAGLAAEAWLLAGIAYVLT